MSEPRSEPTYWLARTAAPSLSGSCQVPLQVLIGEITTHDETASVRRRRLRSRVSRVARPRVPVWVRFPASWLDRRPGIDTRDDPHEQARWTIRTGAGKTVLGHR